MYDFQVPLVKLCDDVWESSRKSSEIGNCPTSTLVHHQRPLRYKKTGVTTISDNMPQSFFLHLLACFECLYLMGLPLVLFSAKFYSWQYYPVWSHFQRTEKLENPCYLLTQKEVGWLESCVKFIWLARKVNSDFPDDSTEKPKRAFWPTQ